MKKVTNIIETAEDKVIEKLLSGEAKPEGQLQEYFVNALKYATVERDRVSIALREHNQKADECRTRLVELQGVGRKAYDDLKRELAKSGKANDDAKKLKEATK